MDCKCGGFGLEILRSGAFGLGGSHRFGRWIVCSFVETRRRRIARWHVGFCGVVGVELVAGNWSFDRSVGHAVGGAELAAWGAPGSGCSEHLARLIPTPRPHQTHLDVRPVDYQLALRRIGGIGWFGRTFAAVGRSHWFRNRKADQAHVQSALAVDRLCGVCIACSALQSTGCSNHFCG